jgi:putative addiction module component (TIGR02574 family)
MREGNTVNMSTPNEILERAMELPIPERAALAHHLLLSLEAEDFDEDSEAAWAAEVEARLAAVAQGQFTASPWREAVARIRQSLADERPS